MYIPSLQRYIQWGGERKNFNWAVPAHVKRVTFLSHYKLLAGVFLQFKFVLQGANSMISTCTSSLTALLTNLQYITLHVWFTHVTYWRGEHHILYNVVLACTLQTRLGIYNVPAWMYHVLPGSAASLSETLGSHGHKEQTAHINQRSPGEISGHLSESQCGQRC